MVNTPNTVGSRRILVVWIGSAIGETHPLRHCDDRRQASNDDGQHVMGHHLFRDVLVSTAPLRCGTEDRPTDGLHRGFDGLHRPWNLRWGLLEPSQEENVQFLLDRYLVDRLKLPIGWPGIPTRECEKVEYGQDQPMQGLSLQGGGSRKLAHEAPLKLLP